MSRPKQYVSAAAKQAAYRTRQEAATVVVDRAALDALHDLLDRLQAAIVLANRNGVPFASRCCAVSTEMMLEKMTVAFLEEASLRAGGTSKT